MDCKNVCITRQEMEARQAIKAYSQTMEEKQALQAHGKIFNSYAFNVITKNKMAELAQVIYGEDVKLFGRSLNLFKCDLENICYNERMLSDKYSAIIQKLYQIAPEHYFYVVFLCLLKKSSEEFVF